MIFQKKLILYTSTYLCISLSVFSTVCFALSSDNQKICRISSQQFVIDQKSHEITYLGNVIATQGSTQMTGDKLIVYFNQQNKMTKMIDYGNPAKYTTIPDAKSQRLYAQAKIINYDAKQQTVLLLHDGRVTQNHDIFSGPHIWYDIAAGIVRSTTNSSAQRTVIVITPEKHVLKQNASITDQTTRKKLQITQSS